MEAKEKSIKHLKEGNPRNNGLYCYELVSEAIDIALKEQAKEILNKVCQSQNCEGVYCVECNINKIRETYLPE